MKIDVAYDPDRIHRLTRTDTRSYRKFLVVREESLPQRTHDEYQKEIAAGVRTRSEEALALRRSGLTFRAMGEQLGVSRERARQRVMRGLRIEQYDQRKKEQELEGPAVDRKIADLEFSIRTRNALKNIGIEFVGELVQKTEDDLLSHDWFGRKSLNEIKALLSELGLSLKR